MYYVLNILSVLQFTASDYSFGILKYFFRTNFFFQNKHFLSEETFFKEELTWFEAQKCCSSRLGQLATIDEAESEIVNCNNIPPDSNALNIWTGNIQRHSEWIEFQGTFNLIPRYTWKRLK